MSDVLVSEIQIVLVFTAAFVVSSPAPLAMTPLQRFQGLRDPGVTLYADDGGELHDHHLRPGVVPPLSPPCRNHGTERKVRFLFAFLGISVRTR
jgi:hypothetical protein